MTIQDPAKLRPALLGNDLLEASLNGVRVASRCECGGYERETAGDTHYVRIDDDRVIAIHD